MGQHLTRAAETNHEERGKPSPRGPPGIDAKPNSQGSPGNDVQGEAEEPSLHSSISARKKLKKALKRQATQLGALIDHTFTYPSDEHLVPKEHDYMQALTESYERKRLFVCCDGTWKNASGTTAPLTNVSKLARAVDRTGKDKWRVPRECHVEKKGKLQQDKDNKRLGLVRQVVHYSSGVGSQSVLLPDYWYSGAVGEGMTTSLLNAYCFICNNYNFSANQDEIILVGFSRGAYTMRCLAKFITDVGLLRRQGLVFLHALFECWKENAGWRPPEKLDTDAISSINDDGSTADNKPALPSDPPKRRRKLQRMLTALNEVRVDRIKIKVLAEWDTVSSMGVWRNEFSFVGDRVPHQVENAFLAVALHEKRRHFQPMLWNSKSQETQVKQCAFVGCHGDVGGGNADPGLSTVSLLWMISQIEQVCSARFDDSTLLQLVAPLIEPGSKQSLHKLSLTKGLVEESLVGIWLVPQQFSLTPWVGERDSLIKAKAALLAKKPEDAKVKTKAAKEFDNNNIPLSIHASARVLKIKRYDAGYSPSLLRCRLFTDLDVQSGPLQEGDVRRWVPTSQGAATDHLLEEEMLPRESELLEQWYKQAAVCVHGWPDENLEWAKVQRSLEMPILGWGVPQLGIGDDTLKDSLIQLLHDNLPIISSPGEGEGNGPKVNNKDMDDGDDGDNGGTARVSA